LSIEERPGILQPGEAPAESQNSFFKKIFLLIRKGKEKKNSEKEKPCKEVFESFANAPLKRAAELRKNSSACEKKRHHLKAFNCKRRRNFLERTSSSVKGRERREKGLRP